MFRSLSILCRFPNELTIWILDIEVIETASSIMTSYSGVVDTTNKVFESTRPGLLSDVFGIRIGSYEEIENMNEISRLSYNEKHIQMNYNGKNIESESNRYDVIEPKGADVLAHITSLDKDYPIITINKYGRGKAIYIGLPARGEILKPLLDDLIRVLSIKEAPNVPDDTMVRQIDTNHVLFLNVSGEPKEIKMKGNSRSILFDKDYKDGFTIAPYEPEFVEIK
jgi:beta-galactosidase